MVFFDIETTIPPTDIIEFGGIVLDKISLYEKESYSTLIKSQKISKRSIDCNGITSEILCDAPSFEMVADEIYSILDNRIWVGHNIIQFDIPIIIRHFNEIGKPLPCNIGIVDTLPLLRNTFGKRAGDLKMASLGKYFRLGQERHRAIEDCRMTIDVLKNCSMTMFLEEHTGHDSDLELIEKLQGRAEISHMLITSIDKGESVWISYDGGSHPLVPRKIKVNKWVHEPHMFEAYCYQSQSAKNFSYKKIIEIRESEWNLERS